MEGQSGVNGSMIDELHSSAMPRDLVEGKSDVTRSISDILHSWDIQRDQMEGQSGVNGSIIDEFHSSDIQISKEIEWKVKVMLLEVSLINFIHRISKEIK